MSGMVRLLLDAGKAQGIRPNDIVGSIAYHADIPVTQSALFTEEANTPGRCAGTVCGASIGQNKRLSHPPAPR